MSEFLLEKKFEIAELLDLRVIGDVIRNLSEMFNVQLRIFDLNGKELFDTGGELHFCGLIEEMNLSDQVCRSVKEKLLTQALTTANAVQILSACGSRYTVLPVTHQFEALGRVVLGPYQDQAVTASKLETLAAQYRVDTAKFVDAYRRLPDLSPEQVKKISRFASKFLDAFIFINTKRLLTSIMHLELMLQAKDRIFKQVEIENQGSAQDREEIEKYKKMF